MEYLLKVSIITAIFYSCYKLFLQRDTFFQVNRWFLLGGLIIAAFLPALVIPIYVEQSPVNNIMLMTVDQTGGQITEDPFDYMSLLPLLYGLGVVIFMTKLVIEFSSLYRLMKDGNEKNSGSIRYIETSENVPPFSFFNYIVYNPDSFSTNELELIMNHEKVHAKQWHSLDIILMHIASVFLWFNPIIWLYKKDLQQNLEFIADDNAQRISSCEKTYQHLLLKATVPNHQLVLANQFYNSLIKKRILMLHKSKSNKLNVLKFTFIIPLLALFLMSFNTKEIYIAPERTNASSDLADIEMLVITKDFTDADLKEAKKEFEAHGVTLKFKNVKRNTAGEITSIKIDAKTSKSSASYNMSAEEGIKPIKIVYDKDSHSISIGNGDVHFDEDHDYHFKTKDGHTVVKSGIGSNVFITTEEYKNHDGNKKHKSHKTYEVRKKFGSTDSDEDHDIEIIIEDDNGNVIKDKNVFIKKSGHVIELDSDGDDTEEKVYIIESDDNGNKIKKEIILKGDGSQTWIKDEDDDKVYKIRMMDKKDKSKMLFISGDDDDEPLILIDGKESSKEAMEKLDPDDIEKMEVIKGDKATESHGKKAKDGIIMITTKTQ